MLSIGFILFVIGSMLETISSPGFLVIIVRIGMVSSVWLWYWGLRKEPEKIKKAYTKKEVKVERDLFRIIKRPEQITEEEISISKEKKNCLVCKGNVSGINYICTECGAFYCMKCSQAISNLENACWVCNVPIDKSKPVKSIKKVELDDIEISENTKKLLKTK